MNRISNTEEFIEKAHKIHSDKYDYSYTNYIDGKHKLKIICKKHGEFWQLPGSHLKGCGCKKCGVENMSNKHKSTTDEFINKSILLFGKKYDYSKVNYINSSTKVCIICPEHGEFWQTPNNHLKGQGCHICSLNKKGPHKKSDIKFIEEAKRIHGDKYDYSKTIYTGYKNKINIVCPIHGVFSQNPGNHLQGQGCPHCNESKLEKNVCEILTKNNILFDRQKRFNWLGRQSLDFYLPEYNIAIECQGRQHIYPVDFSGNGKIWADEYCSNLKILDEVKKEKCENNGVKILYLMSKEIGIDDIVGYENYVEQNTFWDCNDLVNNILFV